MDAIEALHARNSTPKLTDPAPQGEDREAIFQAALRAPDHARLRPWRFLTVEGDARLMLGEKMAAAALLDNADLDPAIHAKQLVAPMRAPLVIIAAAKIVEHPKVPEVEQLLSTGAAVSQMLTAAHALGYAGIWRTGSVSFSRSFMSSVGLASNETIVGFVYLGTAEGRRKSLPSIDSKDFFESWPKV